MSYLCPICKSELLWGGQARYQTLTEHISNPNSDSPLRPFHYCDNAKCEANAPEECKSRIVLVEKLKKTNPDSIGIFWDEYGDLYGWVGKNHNIPFIDNNMAPFGSISRQSHAELRRDENFYLFKVFGIRMHIEYSYKADTDGNIISRKARLRLWRKIDNGYVLMYGWFHMLLFYHKQLKNNIDNFRNNGSIYSAHQINELFRPKYNMNNSAKLFSIYLKIFYPILNIQLKANKDYQD